MTDDQEEDWGNKRRDFYFEGDKDKEQSGSEAEEDEYKEIMRLQQIRAQKMKLAETPLPVPIEPALVSATKPAEPVHAESVIVGAQIHQANSANLAKPDDLPKNVGQTEYGQGLISEYEQTYKRVQEATAAATKDKFHNMMLQTLVQYAGSLQRLIQAKSQDREANDAVEEVLQVKRKLHDLEKIAPAGEMQLSSALPNSAAKSKLAGSAKLKLKLKKKRVLVTRHEDLEPAEKMRAIEKPAVAAKKDGGMKTSLIVAGHDSEDELPAEPEIPVGAKLPQKGYSYLEDYLNPKSGAVPVAMSKAEKKAERKRKARAEAELDGKKIKRSHPPEGNVAKIGEEDAVYQQAFQDQQAAKADRVHRVELKKEEHKKNAESMFATAQRNINYNILKAKGLTRRRKKIDRNPRVKLRAKYDRAVRSRRHAVKEYSGKTDSYGGETTGMRTTLIRSTKLK